MKYWIIFFMTVLISGWTYAQQIRCTPANKEAVLQKLEQIRAIPDTNLGEELVSIGRTFLGTPYVARTLEGNVEESLVVDLQGLDCTTFVENVIAFGLIRREGTFTFDAYLDALEIIRYRDGKLNGYPSRLHYFTEWITDNQKKGLVRDVTAELGGKEILKTLDFMTGHRDLYTALAEERDYEEMQRIEKSISEVPLCVLSVEVLKENEHMLASGDVIALATSINGLDVTHTGFAIRMPDNRTHLLHASSSGEVEISDLPLVDYLRKIKKNTGIIVARPAF
ncbi:N-acetylmuramoyl-L-alanine amidase-like domain-containing protein [Muriicola marianensis]|uniref:DUF1460 domain-containing protein n=1 Tax=Muriicola marianensis TaxID=1324801 RepID=A0ABQ1QXQ1_9FLAO|nr:N-acetylmuramoyl-L-alanine amidase-like domain-containing protein [Muriicola marianensis]GGD48965.1 hypothetical protein GCM10011361_14640 [Muriicola marianensis]